jgi:hypothetical protein
MSRTVHPLATVACAFMLGCGSSAESQPSRDASTGDSGFNRADDPGSQPDDAATDSRDGSASDAGPQDAGYGEHDAEFPVERDAGQLEEGIPDADNIVKMVAPSVCERGSSYIYKCRFGPVDLAAPSLPTEGRFKTRVVGRRKGDCTTQFPFEARLSADGVAPFVYDLGDNDEVFLRRDDDAALASVHVEESSGFAGVPAYDETCRVWLEVSFNEPIEP